MVDSRESSLQQTRHRSIASVKYSFRFIDTFEQTVFPIMQRDGDGNSKLAGTGFFLAPDGIFMSAAHVFEIGVSKNDTFWTLYPDAENNLIEMDFNNVKIRPENRDLAIGQVDMGNIDHPTVSIMELMPEINEVISTFVFSQTLVHEPEEIDGDIAQQIQYRSHWEIGLAEEIEMNGFRHTPGRAFSSSVFVEGGASGGPIINSNGFVVGVNCRGLAPEDGLPYSIASGIEGVRGFEYDGVTIKERRKGLENKPIARMYINK